MAKSKLIHYSALRRITMCGLEIPFKDIFHTNNIDSVDCKKCLKRYKQRERLMKKHGVVE